ncbi:MAG TPA: hypothetical protein VN541_07755, partial [Tepidisphaeraceae bacterium]|nr:hypothetical protein [Tepidisphaeraceae bacterium]
NFLLHPWAFGQFRYAANYRQKAKNGGTDWQTGFELPRMKLVLDGYVYGPGLTYQFIWATSDTTGNLGLQDAWARYHIPDSPFAVQGGQIRNPVDHEQIMFATKSLTPERSIVNNVLLNSDNVVKGFDVSYGYDGNYPVRAELAFTSGMRNFDTTFADFPTNPATWGAAARVEWKVMGRWEDYSQFTALGDKEPLLVFGGGADYTEAGDTDGLIHVADVQLNTPSALTLYAAYLGRYTRHNGGAPGTNGGFTTGGPFPTTYDATARVLGAYLITRHFEPFAKYEYLNFDHRELPASAAHRYINDVGLGFNYYFYGHRAKFSACASWLPNGSPIANTGADLLANRTNEVIFEGQFQLII